MRFVFDSSCEACPRVDPPFCCTTVSIPFAIIALFDRVLSNYVRNLKQESIILVSSNEQPISFNLYLVKNNFVFYFFFFFRSTIPPFKSFFINGWQSITQLFVHCKRKEERLTGNARNNDAQNHSQLSSNIFFKL